MAVEPNLQIWELVDRAVGHQLSVPEFQRGFVWKPVQVRDLVESLWLDYPIGSLLIWNSGMSVEERIARDAQRPGLWIVDGQQRTTALCILFGRKPYWWASAEDWDKTDKRYDVRFDVDAKEPPFFYVADAVIRRSKGDRYIKLSRLLILDTQKDADQKVLQGLAREIKAQGLCDGMDAMEVYTRLDRVRKIREHDLVTVTINHELEDVVEIFSRLNSRGTRVTEADIYLGIVAARAPGWVRDEFLPFLRELKESGFDLGPNLLFKSLTAIAAGKTRYKEIPDNVWNSSTIRPAWSKCQAAWKHVIKHLAEYGVLSNDPLPTQTALVTLIALQNKFPDAATFDGIFYWFLQASRYGRYSGSATTSLDEDVRDVLDSQILHGALEKLMQRLAHFSFGPLTREDMLKEYPDSAFGRFLLYLLAYRNKAKDWDENGHRLGFEGVQLLADFRPQWHHIFPRKFLEGKVDEGQINALANIAVIGPSINIRISSKKPMDYLDRYKISKEKLEQQFISSDGLQSTPERYTEFLSSRADVLAQNANSYLDTLRRAL
ncbi:MAG TPA: DUF262 domain-containing protein [Candidatus Acidoferrales bacterium]|nr:DUF262 domain-containing protein [Candidatus Acidoferrales bacterium]